MVTGGAWWVAALHRPLQVPEHQRQAPHFRGHTPCEVQSGSKTRCVFAIFRAICFEMDASHPEFGRATSSILGPLHLQQARNLEALGRVALPRPVTDCANADEVHLQSCMRRELSGKISGNKFCSTACSLPVILKNLCSKIHCQEGFDLVLFS